MTTHWTTALPTKPGWYLCRYRTSKTPASPSEWPKHANHWKDDAIEFGSEPIANYPADTPKTITLTEEELEKRIREAKEWGFQHGRECEERHVREAVEREREECAKIVAPQLRGSYGGDTYNFLLERYAQIRARGNK